MSNVDHEQMMISSKSSNDDELLNTAYANVSLLADTIWVFDKNDIYRKFNQALWIKV